METRLQELRKSNINDQSEIKELRVKLRVSEHERGQLAAKQGETGEIKKALAATEAKRKEDLRERDRKIADLEKSLAGEKKKREGAELRLQEVKGKVDGNVAEVRGTLANLRAQVKDAVEDAQAARAHTGEVEQREECLIDELEQARRVVHQVAEEYGRLATSTVSLQSHDRLKHEHASLNLRAFRLERKLANSEAQVVELAHLIRGTNDKHVLLSHMLAEVQREVEWYSEATLQPMGFDSAALLDHDSDRFTAIEAEFARQRTEVLEAEVESHRLFSEWSAIYGREVLRHYISLSGETKALDEQDRAHKVTLANLDSQRQRLTSQLEVAQKEHEETSRQAAEFSTHWEETKTREEGLKLEMDLRQKHHRAEIAIVEEKLKKEHESVTQLKSTIQQKKTAEESLRTEVEM